MHTVIDSHHHFWRYSPAEYGWIGPDKQILRRDFFPPDLKQEISKAGVDAVISVQARQTVEETDWLLDLAEANDFIRGVVGWVPLIDPKVSAHLEKWRNRTKLRAVRHVLQDEADDRYMLRPDFDGGISQLKKYDLRYDILIFERHLESASILVDRHPNQIFILDHIAKPKIAINEMEPWGRNLRDLARRTNVYCKVSGMATEGDWKTWTPKQLKAYFDVALEAFTPKRLMFGSDWPVCLLAASYDRWVATVKEWTAALSKSEQERFWGQNAIEAYGLAT